MPGIPEMGSTREGSAGNGDWLNVFFPEQAGAVSEARNFFHPVEGMTGRIGDAGGGKSAGRGRKRAKV